MSILSNRTLITIVLVALVTALVLGAVVLLVQRDDNAPIQIALPTPDLDERTSSSASAQTELKVYVTGAVRNPGVYTLRQDDRLQDEGHYHIPRPGETPPPSASLATVNAGGTASTATSAANGLIDLNVASVDLLDTLPGIGPALATAIVTFREEHGPFESVEEITEVSRIGPATYEKIRDLVTVGDGP